MSIRETTLGFLTAQRCEDVGHYRYAAGCAAPTLYSSTYAAMARHLLDDLQG